MSVAGVPRGVPPWRPARVTQRAREPAQGATLPIAAYTVHPKDVVPGNGT